MKSLPTFQSHTQEDASEFLTSLIECFTKNEGNQRCLDLKKEMFLHFQHCKECTQCQKVRRSETDYVSMYALPCDPNKIMRMKKLSGLIQK